MSHTIVATLLRLRQRLTSRSPVCSTREQDTEFAPTQYADEVVDRRSDAERAKRRERVTQ